MLSKIGNIVLINETEWTVVRPRNAKPAVVRSYGRAAQDLKAGMRILLRSLQTAQPMSALVAAHSFHETEGYTEIELKPVP
jgi:hypothetical protein